jgi:flagellar hook protein FlgE
VPQVLRLSNQFLPASQTTRINYELNLPQLPKTEAYKASQAPGSELLNAAAFMNIPNDETAVITVTVALTGAADAQTVMPLGGTLTVDVGGTPVVFEFYDGNAGPYAGTNQGIDVQTTAAVSISTALAAIQTSLRTNGGPSAADATVGLNGANQLEITLGTNYSAVMTTSTTAGSLGIPTAATVSNPGVLQATQDLARVPTISANNAADFISQSISGGAITVYAENGAPANVQMRWAKVNSVAEGGADRWNLFLMTDSAATGTATQWSRVGGDFVFGSNGSPTPPVEYTDLTNLTVNNVTIGNVRLQHGATGLTQFADPNGTAEVTSLNQNGYAPGEFVSVAVNDNGRVVVSYNNGQQLEVAQVVTANFNAVNSLKRMDGGIFAATSESGEPILDSDGGIIGSALEASNTDISEEFTRLIVTQQAYAAGTRIVSTADEMLQEALNMVR